MLTPQEVQERTFEKAVFGGYDMGEVDDFLDNLTEDYTSLYKENAVLKNKMKVLVRAVEEYREKEQSINSALQNAQRSADAIIAQAQAKAGSISAGAAAQAETSAIQAEASAARAAAQAEAAALQQRLEAARKSIEDYVSSVRSGLRREDELLASLLEAEPVIPAAPVQPAYVKPEEPAQPAFVRPEAPAQPASDMENTIVAPAPVSAPMPEIVAEEPTIKLADTFDEDVAAEIERSVNRSIQAEDEADRKAQPEKKSKFEFIDLQFGKDYEL